MTDTAGKAAGNVAKNAANGTGLGKKATDVITTELRNLAAAVGERAVNSVVGRIGGLTNRLTDIASGTGKPGDMAAAAGAKAMAEGKSPAKSALSAGFAGVKAKFKEALGMGGKGGGGGKKIKVINIFETADVGVPVRVAYDQWTQFADFPSFMKKVENIDQESDEKMVWKAQVFWSHRTWEATIVEQVPDQHIVWRSKGEKGSVDGAVSFHELAPDLTRILLILEYHPQGLFERTGNIWRAQGRRARLEFKHFVRHVMTKTILEQDDLEGWRGEIRDSEVVLSHEDAMEQERAAEDRDDQEIDDRDQEPAEPDEEEPAEPDESDEPDEPQSRPQRRPARPRGGPVRASRGATSGGSRR
jgi:uncharacterized membrane protein